MKTLACLFAAIGSAHFAAAYSPIIDGATADVRIKVVDDLGESVPDATISVTFYTAPEKVDVKRGTTDAQGCFSAKGRCIGEAYAWIRKDGYYNTKISPKFQTLTDNETESRRKWSDETVETTATLKKKRNPAKLILKGGTFQELKYPATNVVMGLDLQRFDWCPPFGKGKYDDLQIKYDFWRSPTNWFQVYSHLDITMTNCLDGVYLVPTDDFSKMNRCYGADTNAVYLKALEYVYDRKTGNVERDVEMPRDKYMVFRTRTKVNDKGELVSANYGLIFEKSEYGIKLNMRTAFNPKPNDTNLECEGGWR